MAGIFINYRTDDTGAHAALVDRTLTAVFGDDQVFRDCRSMRPGTDFPPDLQRRLVDSTVLLALIGPRWLTLTDNKGSRRLDNPADYVRREIRVSLERRITVMPVLVDGTELPTAGQLPDDLAGLSERQVFQLRTRNDVADLNALVDELKRHVPVRQPQSEQARSIHHTEVGYGIGTSGPNSPAVGNFNFPWSQPR